MKLILYGILLELTFIVIQLGNIADAINKVHHG